MKHKFRQSFSERDALRAFSDTVAVLHELVGPLAHASERPHSYSIIRVYGTFTDGFDKAHRERDMLAIHALCRYAKGAALDVLVEEHAASARRHREKLRRENRALWYEFHLRLADSHARIADENRAKAEALLAEPGES